MNTEELLKHFDQYDNDNILGAEFYTRNSDPVTIIFQEEGKQHIVEQLEVRSDLPGVLLVGNYGWKRWFADISHTDDLPAEAFVLKSSAEHACNRLLEVL